MDRVLPGNILASIRWRYMDRSIDYVVDAYIYIYIVNIYISFNSWDPIECGPNLECVVFKRITMIDILSLSPVITLR